MIYKAQEYPLRYFTLKDGLPHLMVPDVFQDSKGIIWIPTYGGGLAKFNGKEIKNYGLNNGLSNLVVRTVCENKNHEIFVGSIGDGIFKIQKDTIIPVYKNLPAKQIFHLIQDKQGAVWAGTEQGIFKLINDTLFENITYKFNLPPGAVTYLSVDQENSLWICYDIENGIFRLKNNTIFQFNKKNGLTNGRLLSTFHDTEQNIWIGAFDGIYKIKKDAHVAEKCNIPGMPDYYLFNFIEPKPGMMMVGSNQEGMIVFNPKTNKILHKIHRNNGLKVSTVFRLFMDRENNIWVCNWGEGVVIIPFNGWTKFSEKNGLPNRFINRIFMLDNKLTVCNPNGIYSYDPPYFKKEFTNIDVESAIHVVKYKDELLIAKEKELLVIKNNKITHHTGKELLAIRSIIKDNNNILYLCGWGSGISTYDGKIFINLTDTFLPSLKYFYSSLKDSKGNLWFASFDAGLIGKIGRGWIQYSTEDGMPSNKITCLTEDKNGNIIAGTNGGGIAIIRHGKVKVLNTNTGLPSNSVFSVLVDRDNNLWAGFQGKIARIKLSTGETEVYANESGFTGDCLTSSIIEYDNQVWVGTNDFLWRFDKSSVIEKKKNLNVIFREILVNNNPIDSITEFRYNQNKFHFEFYSTQIHNAENVKFSYRLLGLDSVYTKPGSMNEVTYHELSPGQYTFEVKAILNKETSDYPAQFIFIIQKPFYKTWWFIVLCSVSAILITKQYIHYRERKLTRKQKELEEIVEQRTEEISEQKNVLEEKQKEILDSIQYARRIQFALLAHDSLLKKHLVSSDTNLQYAKDYFIYFKPKDIVSGDFYWAIQHKHSFYIAACDSTGHGVPGAFMSLLNISFLNEAITEKQLEEPGKILTYVRERLIESISKDGAQDGMDGILIRIEKSTRKNQITYAAANNAPIMIKNKEVVSLPYDKMPVGKSIKTDDFNTWSADINSGEILYLYTDGYADQFGGPKGKKFMYKQLNKLLIELEELNCETQENILNEKFNLWKGDLEQVDDVCVIGLRF